MFDGCSLADYLGDIPVAVMHAIVAVESSRNPFAIGVVGDRLIRQPRSLQEAIATTKSLDQLGKNYSVGLAQFNKGNFGRFKVGDVTHAFDPCTNLQLGAKVLADCYRRAGFDYGKAFSCYYSGNFSTGFEHGYVGKIFGELQSKLADVDGKETITSGKSPLQASLRGPLATTNKKQGALHFKSPYQVQSRAGPKYVIESRVNSLSVNRSNQDNAFVF